MRTSILTFVCSAVFVLAPHIASAQAPTETNNAWLLTPTLGLVLDEDADPSLSFTGALAYPFTSRLALEGELSHAFDLVPDDPAVDSSLTTVHGALLFFFPTEYRLTPYLAGGIGFGKFAHDVTEPPAEIDRTEVGFNFGGGVTYPMNDAIWLRGDVRLLKHVDDVPTIWRFGAGVTIRIGN